MIIRPSLLNSPDLIAGFDTRLTPIEENEISTPFGKNIFKVNQVHSNKVVFISNSDTPDLVKFTEADALITARRKVLLTVRVADCIPILITDAKRSFVAAVHSGWRGIVQKIISETIKIAVKNFSSLPDSMLAAIGPCIGACCYSIGEDVASLLLRSSKDSSVIINRENKLFADLQKLARLELMEAGIHSDKIESVSMCTSCNRTLFYSYRRGDKKNRQCGFIGLI